MPLYLPTKPNDGFIARVTDTANSTTASIGTGAAVVFGNAPFSSGLTIVGNGRDYLQLDLSGFAMYWSAGAAAAPGHFNVSIYDNTALTFVAQGQHASQVVGTTGGEYHITAYVQPFTGSRLFYPLVANSTGANATFTNQATVTYPTYFTARWAGSTGHA